MLDLDASVATIPGIGPRRAAALAREGCASVEDLLVHLPFRYEDRRAFVPLASAREGDKLSFLGTIRAPRLIRTRRRGFTIVEARIEDGSGAIPALWYNQPYLARTLDGRSAYVYGEVRRARTGAGALRLENPQFEVVDPADPDPIHAGRIVPIYEKLGTLSGRALRRIVRTILDGTGGTESAREFLPVALRARLGLPPRDEALREVHFPSAETSLAALHAFATPHQRRLAFEELFLLQIGLGIRRRRFRRSDRVFAYDASPEVLAKIERIVPFDLTQGQRHVLSDLISDLTAPHPMNRLLQGEVGSGKTILAVLAMAVAAESGVQTAFMAPTEILAEQHERSLHERLEPAGYRTVLLTSSIRGPERRRRLEAIRSGEAQVVVGTHALQEPDVVFARLGLVVVDEQHRFGVMQRARLREKGDAPDTLVMTATPIPRTLTLALYGDLDVSRLEELPPGRSPVRTLLREEPERADVYDRVREALAAGGQAFIVYPVVEEREGSDLRAATAMARKLQEGPLAEFGVDVVHGRMKGPEKARVMERFRSGAVRLLLATTVVEVGIDVPSATIVVVEHAERFGLSQLHQLRGRVGRGEGEGICVLMAGENLTPVARERLAAIAAEPSGFRLAEIDLRLRGTGEMLGTRQAGLPDLRVGNLARDQDLMEMAREEASAIVRDDGEEGNSKDLATLHERIRPSWRARFHLADVG